MTPSRIHLLLSCNIDNEETMTELIETRRYQDLPIKPLRQEDVITLTKVILIDSHIRIQYKLDHKFSLISYRDCCFDRVC